MMRFLISSILLAASVEARPFGPTVRRNEVDLGGLTIKAANRLIPVVVGGQQDVFVPNVVTAAVGDIIQFQFSNGNHTVTESTLEAPCRPLQATDPTAIHSGHIPFQDGQTTVGTFNMPITSTKTLFLYCATGPHCQLGQVLVVNPTNDQQIVDYAKGSAAAAENIDGTTVSGGTVASIPLEAAAFIPAPVQDGPPGGAAPPAAEAPAAAPDNAGVPIQTITAIIPPEGTTITIPLAGVADAATLPGTTTVIVTVPAPTSTPPAA
ncbi:hypothetical protein GGS23DRAFT_562234 [Durotheca rogersii]|uniref:uncharacterized protein n=1 Tax=Durotheca rogersii TaxID=419775 RepID=UPI00221F1CFB|nr:uncharacterized protein GGS23DRAFT_562234 [Durotheca rogersii]KAI5864877.1 hypothetical protein GGS23DRAFT_562234 [Durotheca rogersii]